MSKLSRFIAKWGTGGIQRSLERKRARRQQRVLMEPVAGPQGSNTIERLRLARFPNCQQLAIYQTPGPAGRVTIMTDRFDAASLYGGVGSALLLGALLANERGGPLRIITRTEPAAPGHLGEMLQTAGMTLEEEPQFVFAPPAETHPPRVDIHHGELFITTSWWTTAATLGAVPNEQILYLLQEDERMFYPFGDERLYCERTLSQPGIRFAINSLLLKEHLEQEGFDNIARNGIHFEPALPEQSSKPRTSSGAKRRFMFYARPNVAGNLFYFGLEVIRQAVDQGVLAPDRWEIVMVGNDIPRIALDGTSVLETREGMTWQEYGDFLRSVDVALSLMYAPSPSYPPLELAASGARVVTNQFGNKKSLAHYSERILTKPLHVDALVEGLREAILLSETDPLTPRAETSGVGKDWCSQLRPIVERLRT